MAITPNPDRNRMFTDKTRFFRLAEEINAKAGIVYDPTATPERGRDMMEAQGVRPEENLFARDIIRSRYPDEEGVTREQVD